MSVPYVGADTDHLLNAIENADGPVRLIDARIEGLDLDYATVDADRTYPIDLRAARVTGDVTARHADVAHPVRLDGAVIEGRVLLDDAAFTQRIVFDVAELRGPFSAQVARFDSLVRTYGTVFGGIGREDDTPGTAFDPETVTRSRGPPTVAAGAPVFARGAVFDQGLYGELATFGDAADFMNVRFREVGDFTGAAFAAGAVFARSNFADNLNLTGARLAAPTVKLASKLGGGDGIERETTLDGVALQCRGITCRTSIGLGAARLGGDVRLRNVTLTRQLNTTDARGLAPDGGTVTVDLREAETVSGPLGGEGIEYDLTDARLGEADLVGIDFTALWFDDTVFDGFDFGEHKRQLRDADWKLHTEAMSPAERENLYLHAKNGANAIGDDDAAAKFSTREMRARGADHRRRLFASNGLGSLWAWLGNLALRGTCGYGESLLTTVRFSGIVVFAFAAVYVLAGVSPPYSGFGGHLTLSLQAFVSLLLTGPTPPDQTAALLVASEGFVGAFTIALFVFTLTRSINR